MGGNRGTASRPKRKVQKRRISGFLYTPKRTGQREKEYSTSISNSSADQDSSFLRLYLTPTQKTQNSDVSILSLAEPVEPCSTESCTAGVDSEDTLLKQLYTTESQSQEEAADPDKLLLTLINSPEPANNTND